MLAADIIDILAQGFFRRCMPAPCQAKLEMRFGYQARKIPCLRSKSGANHIHPGRRHRNRPLAPGNLDKSDLANTLEIKQVFNR